jgi:hypothetical protein
LTLLLRVAGALLALIVVLIAAISLVASRAINTTPDCLYIDLHEEVFRSAQPATFNYAVIDPARHRAIRATSDNDPYVRTWGNTRFTRLAPNGRRVFITGSTPTTPSISYIGTYGAAAPLSSAYTNSDPLYSTTTTQFRWLPDSRRILGWRIDAASIIKSTTMFTLDEHGRQIHTQTLPIRTDYRMKHITRDGRIVWETASDYEVWSSETLARIGTITRINPFDGALYWHPQTDQFAYFSTVSDNELLFRVNTLDRGEIGSFPIQKTNRDTFSYLQVDWSPDGSKALVTHGTLERLNYHLLDVARKIRLRGSAIIPHTCGGSGCDWPVFAWIPDGSGLVYPEMPSLFYNDPDQRRLGRLTFEDNSTETLFERVGEYRYLPNGWLWVEGLTERGVWVAAIKDGRTIQLETGENYANPNWSPTMNGVVVFGVSSVADSISWINFPQGTSGTLRAGPKAAFKQWSGNERAAVYQTTETNLTRLWVLDTHTGMQTAVPIPPSVALLAQASHDARFVGVASLEGNMFALEVREVATGQVVRRESGLNFAAQSVFMPQTDLQDARLQIAPDGRYLALYTAYQMIVLDVQSGAVTRYPMPELNADLIELRWSSCSRE